MQIQSFFRSVDRAQQKHPLLAFSVAVIKKYGDDQAGYKAALLTYYGFLSLFPLLLLLTTLTDSFGADSHLKNAIIRDLTNYFPLLGSQLSSHVHAIHKNGFALLAGVLFTLYGTRGVADVFRHGVQDIWRVPQKQRESFLGSLVKSLVFILVGGCGLLIASALAGFASAAGKGLAFSILSALINLLVLFWLYMFLLNYSLPRHVSAKEILPGAAVAAVGLVVMQLLGTYILARELKSLDALYSYFAIALGLLFWIYLQAQVLYYAVEISVVASQKLWPRSLTPEHVTEADKKLAHPTID